MLYTFLIFTVFIAELIILCTLIINLVKLDKALIALNTTIDEVKPAIKSVLELIRKISEQLVELAQDWVEDIRIKKEDATVRVLNKLLIAFLLWNMNSKFIKKLRRSKLVKTLYRGFAFVQSMV